MWTLGNALPIIKIITQEANKHGYLTALYGSVLTNGAGRDLDLQLIPKRFCEDIVVRDVWLFKELATLVNGKIKGEIYEGMLETKSCNIVLLNSGLVIDIVLQPTLHDRRMKM